jgi:hypothetical protein
MTLMRRIDFCTRALCLTPMMLIEAEQPDHALRERELQQMTVGQRRREGDRVADRAGDDRRVADDRR